VPNSRWPVGLSSPGVSRSRDGVAQPPLSEHAGSVTREQVFHFGSPLVWVDGTAFDKFGQ
jgi:hypothetical protein